FQHEIDFAQAEVRKLEDRILDRMSDAEVLEKNVKTAEAALKEEMAEVEKEKKVARERTEADRAELAERQGRRAATGAGVTPDTLQKYEHIRKHRGGIAIAVVRDGRCTACNVILRLHFYQQVRTNEEVLTCEACSRILYYTPPEETLKDASQEVADCSL